MGFSSMYRLFSQKVCGPMHPSKSTLRMAPALVVKFYLVVCVCMFLLLCGIVHKEARPILLLGVGNVGGSCDVFIQ